MVSSAAEAVSEPLSYQMYLLRPYKACESRPTALPRMFYPCLCQLCRSDRCVESCNILFSYLAGAYSLQVGQEGILVALDCVAPRPGVLGQGGKGNVTQVHAELVGVKLVVVKGGEGNFAHVFDGGKVAPGTDEAGGTLDDTTSRLYSDVDSALGGAYSGGHDALRGANGTLCEAGPAIHDSGGGVGTHCDGTLGGSQTGAPCVLGNSEGAVGGFHSSVQGGLGGSSSGGCNVLGGSSSHGEGSVGGFDSSPRNTLDCSDSSGSDAADSSHASAHDALGGAHRLVDETTDRVGGGLEGLCQSRKSVLAGGAGLQPPFPPALDLTYHGAERQADEEELGHGQVALGMGLRDVCQAQ